ncbi:MAG: hypothetical protein C0456_01440 [Hyphomonas sp.]|uniref:hypothetical protein n=1 Tax=Hyphomonas sp. TaxID=87 RepID=UPI001D6A6FD1|nr:hypothetical protein [Hyphomonas sp.]MBA4225268.1 hypothetical protein [Hyphomonas sp.]
MIRLLSISLIAGCLAGCASGPAAKQTASAVAAMESPVAEVPAEGLPPQKLAAGECGLFLWGMAAPRRFTFFTEASSGEALVLHNGAAQRLIVTDTDGEVFGQFFTETQYLSADGTWSVNLSLKPGEMLEGGQRVESGRLVTTGADGWETVLPVTGVRACIPG